MRISDWSSDVCASDLEVSAPCAVGDRRWRLPGRAPWPPRSGDTRGSAMDTIRTPIEWSMDALREAGSAGETASGATLPGDGGPADRQSVVQGQRVAVRVDLGGSPRFQKKHNNK